MASQTKNPTVKIAKPTNAIFCCRLAWANENAVWASMMSFSSAECGADHFHGELRTQDHEVDHSDPEYYLDAPQCFDLLSRNP
jgi:hypothetical protein